MSQFTLGYKNNNVVSNLARNSTESSKKVNLFFSPVKAVWNTKVCLFGKFEIIFNSMKNNVAINLFDKISNLSFMIFHSFLIVNVFLPELNVFKVSPIFKSTSSS